MDGIRSIEERGWNPFEAHKEDDQKVRKVKILSLIAISLNLLYVLQISKR